MCPFKKECILEGGIKLNIPGSVMSSEDLCPLSKPEMHITTTDTRNTLIASSTNVCASSEHASPYKEL